MKRMHKIPILFLAILMLAGNVVHYPFYLFAINEVKKEMQHEILNMPSDSDQAVTLYFSKKDFDMAHVEDSELCANGNWYDIISVSKSADGKIAVKCLSDSKEIILTAWLKKVNEENAENPYGKSGKHSQLNTVCDAIPIEKDHVIFSPSFSAMLSFHYPVNIQTGFSSLPEIPPRA